MPAGTIALTINSKTVTGSGTAFTTELKVNDFVVAVVGGVTYTLGVAAIASNTSLTLNTAFGGPTTSGLAWTAVPNQVLVGITAQVASDTARAIRGLNYDKDNWQKIYSDVASVTVKRPDGGTFTGPSWGYMAAQYTNKASLVNGAVPIAQGGTGGKTQADARTGLGLGTAATRNAYSTSGDMLSVGDFGIGIGGPSLVLNDSEMLNWMRTSGSQFARNNTTTIHNKGYAAGVLARAADTFMYISAQHSGSAVTVAAGSGSVNVIYDLWTSRNTTVDTNNFIKRASPIARLTNDVSQMQQDFAADEQHVVAGLVSVNAEAEGVSAEKSTVGVYLVKGAIGLADEGWTLEVPQDINGNRLCFVELATDKEGVITVSVFKRRFDVDSAMIVAGDPMDIPEGRWIDLRLQMPENSAWNTRMREMEPSAQGEEPTS